MRSAITLILFSFCKVASAKVAVFWENSFPTVKDAYSREPGVLQTYNVSQTNGRTFVWRSRYSFLPFIKLGTC
jgi:hypothetical protein